MQKSLPVSQEKDGGYSQKDSKGGYSSDNVIEYLGGEEKHGATYHVFGRWERIKRYFTEDFHCAFTLLKDKEGWRNYESFDQPDKFFEFPLQVGKMWQQEVYTSRIEGDPPKPRTYKCVMERKVVDYVSIEIKGKSYEAYKIEGKCIIHRGAKQTYWYAPSIKNWVKRISYQADGSWYREELMSYEPK